MTLELNLRSAVDGGLSRHRNGPRNERGRDDERSHHDELSRRPSKAVNAVNYATADDSVVRLPVLFDHSMNPTIAERSLVRARPKCQP